MTITAQHDENCAAENQQAENACRYVQKQPGFLPSQYKLTPEQQKR
jgi:hypothetical protein